MDHLNKQLDDIIASLSQCKSEVKPDSKFPELERAALVEFRRFWGYRRAEQKRQGFRSWTSWDETVREFIGTLRACGR